MASLGGDLPEGVERLFRDSDALRLADKGQLRGGHGVSWGTLATLRYFGWVTPDNRKAVGFPYFDSLTDSGRAILDGAK